MQGYSLLNMDALIKFSRVKTSLQKKKRRKESFCLHLFVKTYVTLFSFLQTEPLTTEPL